MSGQESKLPLPQFLKILTSSGIPAAKAMAITGKIYKECSTPSQLSELTDNKLAAVNLSNREDRKLVLSAFRKAGYVYKGKTVTKKAAIERNFASSSGAGPSKRTGATMSPLDTSSPSKRKRLSDENEFLPNNLQEEFTGSFDFNEILDENQLRNKYCVINRAPVMTAWSMIVAERLGFKRDEALSIEVAPASVYTEMNAISKGVSLGAFKEGKGKGMEATPEGSQPYVDIMGRSPLYQTQEGQWRALSSGSPAFPGAAFSYISRSFKQKTAYIIGSLQLLALSYPPKVLNTRGWSLYADFRPEVDGWGKRSDITCNTILGLRPMDNKASGHRQIDGALSQPAEPHISLEGSPRGIPSAQEDEPHTKRARDAVNDKEAIFHSADLDGLNGSNKETG